MCKYECVCFEIHQASSKTGHGISLPSDPQWTRRTSRKASFPSMEMGSHTATGHPGVREALSGLDSEHCPGSPRGQSRLMPGVGAPFNAIRNQWVPFALGFVTGYVSLSKQLPLSGFCSSVKWVGWFLKNDNKKIFVHTHIEFRCQSLDACMVYWIVLTCWGHRHEMISSFSNHRI